MTLNGHEVVRYRPEFKNQIAELQTNLWGPDIQTNLAYFEWKYENNPYIIDPLIYVTLSEGQVVGMVGFIGSKWETVSPYQTFFALSSGDVVIHPSYRDQGLYSNMLKVSQGELATSKFKFLYCMSALNRLSRFSLLMNGWQSVGSYQKASRQEMEKNAHHNVKRYAKKIPYIASITSRLKRAADSPLPNISTDISSLSFFQLDRLTSIKGEITKSTITVSKIVRLEDMVDLIERNSIDGRYRLVRDKDYLNWRFQSPRSQYRFLYLDGVGLEGYLVLQISTTKNTKPVRILDWEYTKEDVFLDLMQVVVDLGHFSELLLWFNKLPEDIQNGLKKLGFDIESQEKMEKPDVYFPGLIIKPNHQDDYLSNQILLDFMNWDLRLAFSDEY